MNDTQLILVFLGLLIGVTCVWQLYRVLRGSDSNRRAKYTITGSLPIAADLQALIASGGAWPCETCRSVNQPWAGRCYKCRARRPVPPNPLATPIEAEPRLAPEPAAAVRPARRTSAPALVPVIARRVTAEVAQASGQTRPVVTAIDAGDLTDLSAALPGRGSIRRLSLPDLPVAGGVPVMEKTAGGTLRAVGSMARADDDMNALPPTSVGCPLLGLRDDPRSHYDFPHPRHRCGATRVPEIVSQQHQRTFCCGTYANCVRFRAHEEASGKGEAVAAGPVASRRA